MPKTFEPIRPGDEETYTVDVQAKGWLKSGDAINTGLSVFSTTETGITIVSQSWSDGDTKANVRVRGVTDSETAYALKLRLKTNLRDVTKVLYLRVSDAAG